MQIQPISNNYQSQRVQKQNNPSFGAYEEQVVTTTTRTHDVPEIREREELNKLLGFQDNHVSSVEHDNFRHTTTLSLQPNKHNIKRVTFPYELTQHSAPIIVETEQDFKDTKVSAKFILSETEPSNKGVGLRTMPERLKIKANQTIEHLLGLARRCKVQKP